MVLGKFAVDYEERVNYPRLRAERLQRAKDEINKASLGAVVTWDEANVRYMTGYYITTPNRPLEAQFCFCARNGDPHIIGGNDQEGLIERMPWMEGRIHAPAGIAKIAA
ncbi:MAG: aminopeptidase P family N-terminal domain-containing protein, partial [Thermoleophilia bacterium]|nr:aminopeptidase P family N-terminal domain-containing protein [Thermoleophilia bacterium]